MRRTLEADVIAESLARLVSLYDTGNTVVCSFSAGKDSGVCLELCILAARETGRLPVQVTMRDEEIMLPGTYEYAERVADRPEVEFHWLIAGQPVVNCFDRKEPYWWVFDPAEEERWVRRPPERAEWIEEQHIEAISSLDRFPAPPGGRTYAVIGLRASESPNRLQGIWSSGGWLTKHPNGAGVYKARPIYDWQDGDVWKAIKDGGWDYNHCYDVMARAGMALRRQRVAPPTMSPAGIPMLALASRTWPQWFDAVATRCPGIRTAAMFGRRSVEPVRRQGESWSEAYDRTCVREAPEWIAVRARKCRELALKRHSHHSTKDFPEVKQCERCGTQGSWYRLAMNVYMGDPLGLKTSGLGHLEPEFFREGAGVWGGSPAW